MNATVTEHNGYAIARLQGTLDENSADGVDEQLHTIIEARGNRLLVDLSETNRVTSRGLGGLVMLVARANAKGSQVVLAHPGPFVTSVLDATNLTKFFDIEPTVEDGVARLLTETGESVAQHTGSV